MSTWTPHLDAAALMLFVRQRFPPGTFGPEARSPWSIDTVEEGRLTLRLAFDGSFLRPGGTISGPTMMTLADTAMYLLVLSHAGPLELAVTTSLHIDFLLKPGAADLLAEAELLKLGRRLAVGRVTLRSDGDPRAVAHASVTYALPA